MTADGLDDGILGALDRQVDDYERRPGQDAMASAVARALDEERILVCEAGTGIGKTFAYLAPAIASGKKVVISTATRALQEQVFLKDLPAIERMLGRSARAVMMKGLSNYLCRRRFHEYRLSPAPHPETRRRLSVIEAWLGDTESGDVAELASLKEDDPIWAEVTSSSDTRVGARCPHFRECFVTQMREAAESARLLVVNHHLFFADLALRGPHPAKILPDYDAVIFDEAHQLEDIATQFFGVRVSEPRILRLLGDAERALALSEPGGKLFVPGATQELLEGLRNAHRTFWRALSKEQLGSDLRVTLAPGALGGETTEAWFRLDAKLDMLASVIRESSERAGTASSPSSPVDPRAPLVEQVVRRAELLREQLRLIVEGERGRVSWFDRGKAKSITSAPIDVSNVLRDRIFERIPAVVLTSATLASTGTVDEPDARGPFAYLRERLGMVPELDVTELQVPSPFAFAEQALLYTPDDLPAPGARDFPARAAERCLELIEITGGGAFILTTSLRTMQELHRALAPCLGGRPLFLQGQSPKGALIRAFREALDAVLVATLGFWEGVDVPGAALRLVVLEKVPFAPPTDPLVRARAAALEERGQNPFLELFVPHAAIALKQGFGRLIRRRSDRGVVALLDHRVHRRGYGQRLLGALPPASRTSDLEQVRAFWRAFG